MVFQHILFSPPFSPPTVPVSTSPSNLSVSVSNGQFKPTVWRFMQVHVQMSWCASRPHVHPMMCKPPSHVHPMMCKPPIEKSEIPKVRGGAVGEQRSKSKIRLDRLCTMYSRRCVNFHDHPTITRGGVAFGAKAPQLSHIIDFCTN